MKCYTINNEENCQCHGNDCKKINLTFIRHFFQSFATTWKQIQILNR